MTDDLERVFPIRLLTAGPDERLDFFRDYYVDHLVLNSVIEDILEAVHKPGDKLLILVCGALGVGKSVLSRALYRRLIHIALSNPDWNPGHIPAVLLELISADGSIFNWRDFYIRTLNAMSDTLLPHKLIFEEKGFHYQPGGKLVIDKIIHAPALRREFEKVVFHRGILAFIFDEAHHLLKLASGAKRIDQLETFKSLADMTRTPYVLIGTHRLIRFSRNSGQLDRRMHLFQMDRYNPAIPEHVEEFCTVLHTFLHAMPLPEVPNLDIHWEYFFEKSLGEVGILKDWLYDCLKAALTTEDQKLTLTICEKKATAIPRLMYRMNEILRGEELFARAQGESESAEVIEQSRLALRHALGFNVNIPQKTARAAIASPLYSPKKPGRRNPERDKVGD